MSLDKWGEKRRTLENFNIFLVLIKPSEMFYKVIVLCPEQCFHVKKKLNCP